jgi:hypothetical protein
MSDKIYAVPVNCGNGDTVTIYESVNESDARARYESEVAKQGTSVDIAGWTEHDQAWRRVYFVELVKITTDEDGDIVDIHTLEMSSYFWLD